MIQKSRLTGRLFCQKQLSFCRKILNIAVVLYIFYQ